MPTLREPLPEYTDRCWGAILAICSDKYSGSMGETAWLRNPSLWEVRNHTLQPANTLAKVSRRDLPAPDFNSIAAEDPEKHPQGPPPAHMLPLSSLHNVHTLSRTHKAVIAKSTHRISKSRSARKAPSSMQLMWLLSSCLWESKGEHEGWAGAAARGWAAGRHPWPPSACPSTRCRLCWSLPGAPAEPACLPRCSVSSLWLSEGTTQASAPKAVRSQ